MEAIKYYLSNNLNEKVSTTLIDNSIITITDTFGRIKYANDNFCKILGYDTNKIIGETHELFKSPLHTGELYRNLWRTLKMGQKWNGVLNDTTLSGKIIWFDTTIIPIEDDDKNIVKYLAIYTDITKRIALENKLKQKTKDLELFLYSSAHDLKAPFSSAEGLLNLLKEEDVNPDIMELTGMLETTIKKGKALADDLTLVSIISEKKNLSKEIDFNAIIEHVLTLLSDSRNFELFEINIDIDNSHTFNSNPELMSSIFQNLIQNAITYAKEPSKECTPFINVTVRVLQKEVVIEVCDNGQGITDNCINKIFDLYYRANLKDVPGNGLGLYIVKNIVENLNGVISVNSDKNKGACFEIILPNSL